MERRVWPYLIFTVLTLGLLAGAVATAVIAGKDDAGLRQAAYWLAGALACMGVIGVMAMRDMRRLRDLAASQRRLGTALEAGLDRMPDGLAVYDQELRLIWCNHTYRTLLGSDGNDLAPGDPLPNELPGAAKETSTKSGGRIAIDKVDLDGGFALSVIRDITREKESEAKERALRERFRLHLSAAGGWIWESDVLDRFTILTPVRPEIDPADLEWLVGRHLRDLAPAGLDSSGALESCLRDMAMQRRMREVTLWLHDGRRLRSVRLSGVPRFDSGGNFLGYSGVGSFAAAGILPESVPKPVPRETDLSFERARRAAASTAKHPQKLLVAEDSQTNRLLAQSILQRMGYEVDSVENGRQAVDAVRDGDYGAVLMDVRMPEMDGLKAAAEIRALPQPKGSIPIVAMTAHASAEDRQRCIDAGMDEHVAKPIDRARLADVLHELVGPGDGLSAEPAAEAENETEDDDGTMNDVSLPSLVDFSIIAELKEDAGDALVDELISTYMAETNDRLRRMDSALQEGRHEEIGADAHAMKSSSGTFGALRLEALAAQLEAASMRRDEGRIAELMKALPDLVSETWAALATQGQPAEGGGAGG